MEAARSKTLFLQWALLNALAFVFLVVLGALMGGRIHGAPLVSIPIILSVLAYANIGAGKICWEANDVVPGSRTAERLLHKAEWIRHWAWQAQMIGILSAVFGFFFLLTGGGDLHHRILQGGIVFTGTFVGIFVSQLLEHIFRMIEDELGA